MRRAQLTMVLLCLAIAAGCGGNGDGGEKAVDRAGLPYSFRYPDDFSQSKERPLEAGSGFRNETTISKQGGADLISVQTTKLRRRVTPRLLPRTKRELAALVRRAGRVRGRRDVEVGGLKGVRFRLELREAGLSATADWTYLPRGRTLYWIVCQWQRERDAVAGACSKVLDSFKPR